MHGGTLTLLGQELRRMHSSRSEGSWICILIMLPEIRYYAFVKQSVFMWQEVKRNS